MGKVRPEHVKRLARKLVERFPDKFTTEFEHNKKLVDAFTSISSTKFRNRVAGYAIRLVREQITENTGQRKMPHKKRKVGEKRSDKKDNSSN